MKAAGLGKLLLRVAVTGAALYLTFAHVPLAEIWPLLSRADWMALTGALLCLHLAQVLSAFRTQLYLRRKEVHLSWLPSLQLHYVGGMFNAFLPGATGGDAYKAWWLKHYAGGGLLRFVSLMISNRLNGVWCLGLVTGLLLLAMPTPPEWPAKNALVLAALALGTLSYHGLTWKLWKESLRQQYHAGLYSFGLQALLACCAALLLAAIGYDAPAPQWFVTLALFMLSCLVSMLPLSIGGMGLREYTLLHGSHLLHLPQQQSVALAFAFSLLNLTIPLLGAAVYACWKNPRATEEATPL